MSDDYSDAREGRCYACRKDMVIGDWVLIKCVDVGSGPINVFWHLDCAPEGEEKEQLLKKRREQPE